MRLLIYVILMTVAAGCAGHSGRTPALDAAERLLPTDPTAALERLNGMDVTQIGDSAIMARWALLYSEAMVANGLYAPTDTIADIAVGYYAGHGMREEAARASRLKALMTGPEGTRDRLAESLYLQKEREYWLYRERVHRERLTAVMIFLIFAAGAVIIWQRQRMHLQEAHASMLVGEAAALRADMLCQRQERSETGQKLAAMMADRFAMVDELCGTYFESQGTKTERKAVAEKVKTHIDAIKTDSDIFAGMERCVDLCREGMVSALKEEWPDMKPEDYRLMVYLACGLSSRSVALLVDESVPVVYKRKSRLKSRIAATSLPHRDLFLSVF